MNISKKMILSIVTIALCITVVFFNFNKENTILSTTPLQNTKYNITKDLEIATKNYNLLDKAIILSGAKINQEAISLVFEELASPETMAKILSVLEQYHSKATFFVTGNECAEKEDVVKEIVSKGHYIANLTVDGKDKKEQLDSKDSRKDFVLSSKIIEETTKTKPTYLRCNNTKYTDIILANAKASGHSTVVAPSDFISYQSFNSFEQTKQYALSLESGSILAIKTKGVLSKEEYKDKDTLAIDKPSTTIETNTNQDKDIVQIVTWLLESLQHNKQIISLMELTSLQKNYQEIPVVIPAKKQKAQKDFSSLITSNQSQQVTPISMFYTTKKAVSYTFKGISNKNIKQVLSTLDAMRAKATFFVTVKDIEEHRDIILEIIRRGHEIGNGGVTNDTKVLNYSTAKVCQEIYACHQAIIALGVNTSVYMPANGNTNESINLAVSTIRQIQGMQNYELIAGIRTPMLSKYANLSANDIVNDYFNEVSYLSLRRGDIVYFKLDNNSISDTEKINLLVQINEQLIKNGRVKKLINGQFITTLIPLNYRITALSSLQNIYETKEQNGRYHLVEGKGEVYENKIDSTLAYQSISSKHIGNPEQNNNYFEDQELYQQLDRTGVINTGGKPVIFLTFDDWAGDPATNNILDVLDKHNAKASFFIISRNVDKQGGLSNVNPNLLRTMALKGHDIGSHMYDHETLGASDDIVKKSIPQSYQVLHQVIGDLPALKPYFRPPQLLITGYGLKHVMASGYQYSISGTQSTGDYEKSSADEILTTIEEEIRQVKSQTQGTIFVMHINDQSSYTAQAVDAFLTKNEQGAYGVTYELAKLSEYLR